MGSSEHPSLTNATDDSRQVQSGLPLRVDCQSAEQSILLLGRMYAALSATSDAILRAKSPDELYRRVCDAAVRGGKFISAAAIIADPDAGNMRVVVTSGVGAQQLRDAAVSIDPALPQGRGMVGQAFASGNPPSATTFSTTNALERMALETSLRRALAA